MPKLSFLLLAALIWSCSRDTNSANKNSDTLADGSVQYKVNGSLVTIKSIPGGAGPNFIKRVQGGPLLQTYYLLNAYQDADNQVSFAIVSDSLHVGNYTYDSTYGTYLADVTYNGHISKQFYQGDYININITFYSNGYISGDFTAKLSPFENGLMDYSKRGTTLITEGIFKNIPCFYQ